MALTQKTGLRIVDALESGFVTENESYEGNKSFDVRIHAASCA